MPTAAEHLTDIVTRLAAHADVLAVVGAADKVFNSRIANIPQGRLPAIAAYRPEERGDSKSGGHPLFEVAFTFAIEIRVAEIDAWDTVAGAGTQACKNALFKDPAWTKRWREIPSYTVRQFRERDGEKPFCGEVITLTCTDAVAHEYRPTGPSLTKIHVEVDVKENGGPDGTPEVQATFIVPED